MHDPLLVELLTEELPPKALERLMHVFSHGIFEGLKEKNFLTPKSEVTPFASPRRLAVRISGVLDKQADRQIERKGPALTGALDDSGNPTPALLGFAKSCGVEVTKLERQAGEKGDYFVFRAKQKGELLKQHLPAIVESALKKLPVPKVMRWGSGEVQFVRPVHSVILLHGKKLVPGSVLGLKSANKTRGHRFLSQAILTIRQAQDYEKILKQAKVIAAFGARRKIIEQALDEAAHQAGKGAHYNLGDAKTEKLVDEVASLVEYPVVLTGSFDPAFLQVPRECLVSSMQQHQKYFPLVDKQGRLLSKFLFVSNMQTTNPKQIIQGNERVLRARLADARFFFEQDRKTRLETRTPRLANVVYHNKLGNQLERTERLVKLAGEIAQRLGADPAVTERAAYLAKADLLTEMVGEFPELQGVMGRYYALHDGEPQAVAEAIEQHYWPRFAGDVLPASNEAAALALAERLDAMAGLFGIGQQPTGDKDPFALRRAALGLIRILVERNLAVRVQELVELAYARQPRHIAPTQAELVAFIFERLNGYLREGGYSALEVEAVLSLRPASIPEIPRILQAVKLFQQLPEAAALAAANKRIVNILRKAGREFSAADRAKLVEPAEHALFDALQKLRPSVEERFEQRDYAGALQRLAGLKQPVDAFFEQVMVMVEDQALRENRLALLGDLRALMNRVADISRLAV